MRAPKNDKNTDSLGSDDDSKKDRIQFVDIDQVRDKPNFLDPCIKILRTVFERANNGKDFEVEFSITYTSREQRITKTVTLKVSDLAMDEDSPDKGKYVQLKANIDLSEHPPDLAPSFTGSVKLFKNKDQTRTLEAEASK